METSKRWRMLLSPQWRWAPASDRGSQAPASLTGDRAWSGTRQPAKSARADRSRPWLAEIQSNAAHLVHGRLIITTTLAHRGRRGRPHGVIAGASRPIVPTVSEPAWSRLLLFRSMMVS